MAKKKVPLTEEKIRNYEKELVGTEGIGGFYSQLRTEQKTDQQFYDDTFETSIKKPYRVSRTGSAARIADSACDGIDTSNSQVFCEPRKKTKPEEEKATKRTRLLNHWVKLLSEEIEEAKKNNMRRGEAFFQVEYNENYDPNNDKSLPVIITAPDPMIIYADPHEVGGVPRRVIKSCYMNVGQVEQMFPQWSNPSNKKTNDLKGVKYLAYWDANTRLIEADKEIILGPQLNIYGFTPFSHCVSGFGKRSPEGKPETKIVGRLRRVRDTLIEQCEVQSRINSQIALFTDPVILIEPTVENPPEAPKEGSIEFSPGRVITGVPGWKVTIFQGAVPGPQMYNHLYQINAMLGLETPPVALGLPSTSRATGRQEDIYSEHYSRKYRTFRKNLEQALATALGMGLRIIEWHLKEFPKTTKITSKATIIEDGKEIAKEETITKEDIDGCYDCRVEFKAKDELGEERNFIKYERLAGQGRISWKALLVKGMGYTEDEADEEITEALAETAWKTNPQMLAMVLAEALERAGQHGLLRKMREEAEREIEMAQTATPTGETSPRPSEARNPLAREIMRQTLEETPVGLRRPPGGV